MALPTGICSICLQEADLTKEHVPPASAFNDKTVIAYDFETSLKIAPWDSKPWAKRDGLRGTPMKGGAGYNRLCSTCNNALCTEYAEEYGRWAKQAANHMKLLAGGKRPQPLYFGRPLRFMKQVVAMFLVTGGPEFTLANFDLRRFVMQKRRRFIGAGVRIHAYVNTSNRGRSAINSSTGNGEEALMKAIESDFTDFSLFSTFSEVSQFPFGFTLTRNSEPPDNRLRDITYLARYGYDEFVASHLFLPIFPVVTNMCGQYLTYEEALLATNPESGPEFFGIRQTDGDV